MSSATSIVANSRTPSAQLNIIDCLLACFRKWLEAWRIAQLPLAAALYRAIRLSEGGCSLSRMVATVYWGGIKFSKILKLAENAEVTSSKNISVLKIIRRNGAIVSQNRGYLVRRYRITLGQAARK
jgi:hypothetical protein